MTLIDKFVGILMDLMGFMEGRMTLELCLEKELCVSNTWYKRDEKKKVSFIMGKNETEIEFVLIKKEHWRFIV